MLFGNLVSLFLILGVACCDPNNDNKVCSLSELIFVGPGFGSFGGAEIISLPLGSDSSSDVLVDDYPAFSDYQSWGLVAGFVNGNIIVCGTILLGDQCHSLNISTGQWEPFMSMNSRRFMASSVMLSNGDFMVLGGDNGYTWNMDSEYFSIEQQQWVTGPSIPNLMVGSCAVEMNDTHFLITGGWDHAHDNFYSYISDGKEFVQTNSFSIGREDHACGLMPDGRIMVAGGQEYHGDFLLSSVEIFDPLELTWEAGVELPLGLTGANLVSDGDDMLLLGGFEAYADYDDDGLLPFTVHNEIYRLSPGDTEWTLADTKMKHERLIFPVIKFQSDSYC